MKTRGDILNDKGMTLIEIIIAMALLSFIAIAVLSLLSSTFIGILNFGENTEEVFISQDYVESVLRYDYDPTVGNNPAGSVCQNFTTTSVTFTFGGQNVSVIGEECSNEDIEVFIPRK
jgi:prepilin-type N-terminal cleavage/methylation domain-containing protein